jgi:hypothetical protein
MSEEERLVYESPDGGETIYARPFGTTARVLVSMSPKAWERINEREQTELWQDMRQQAKSNPALQKAIDRAIIIYKLGKEHGQTST